MKEKRTAYRILVGNPKRKRPLRRPCGRWVDNVKMCLLETGLCGVNWIGLAQDRQRWRAILNLVMNLRVPQKAWKVPGGGKIYCLSSSAQLHKAS
jgi:hypothetical protein